MSIICFWSCLERYHHQWCCCCIRFLFYIGNNSNSTAIMNISRNIIVTCYKLCCSSLIKLIRRATIFFTYIQHCFTMPMDIFNTIEIAFCFPSSFFCFTNVAVYFLFDLGFFFYALSLSLYYLLPIRHSLCVLFLLLFFRTFIYFYFLFCVFILH